MTQKQTKQRGFTIVELLIVVVIIAILAAITIVAYNGIQNRAKTSAAAGAASTLQKKLEAYNTDSTASIYPATVAAMGLAADSASTWYMTTGATGAVIVTAGATALAAAPADAKTIDYYQCNAGKGYKINYWDYSAPGIKTITGGDQTNCTTKATS